MSNGTKNIWIIVLSIACFILVLVCIKNLLHRERKAVEPATVNKEEVYPQAPNPEIPQPAAQSMVEEPTNSSDNSEESVAVATAEEEPAPATPEPTVEDPYGMYEVTEEWMQNGSNGYCVEKNGKLYAVAAYIPIENVQKYDVGYDILGGTKLATLFMMDGNELEMPTDDPFVTLTVGDVPILQLTKDDKIRGYGTTDLSLSKTEFIGYTISVAEYGDTLFPIIDHNYLESDAKLAKSRKDEFGAYRSSDEEPIGDIRHLDYGEKYTFYWFTGTDYHETDMVSNCKAFRISSQTDQDEMINLTGKRNKGGFAEFDLSGLEPGFYTTGPYVFEIIE